MDHPEVSMTQFRSQIGKLVRRAARGAERIVLLSRGEPLAALIGTDDLSRLDDAGGDPGAADADGATEATGADGRSESGNAHAAADRVRAAIRSWQKAHRIAPPSASTGLGSLPR